MKEKQAVTREYRPRYQKATKEEKRALLDEFTQLTGYHRKSAVRLLRDKPVRELLIYLDGEAIKLKPEKKRPANRTGKRVYTEEVIASLRLVWTFFWYKCGKILAPLMRQQMDYIARWPAFHLTRETAEKLKTISPATIDRYLKKDKEALRLKGKSLTKPLLSLKSRIPIRTFYSGEERKTPGFWQIDTVHHCGQATSGQYLLTLTATDVASGWLCLYSLHNKAHTWTFQSLTNLKNSVPLPVLEFHSDNGSEFINSATEIWCGKEHLPFTRSRDHKKNDNCFVEQKNGAVVREYVGYDRLEGLEEQALLAAVYTPLVPLLNFFMPTRKLTSKTRIGSKEIRIYDEPQSPFHRLIACAELPQEYKDTLKAQCALYNPVELQQNVNKALLRLRQRLAQINRIRTQKQD
ncbi:MAG: DDE-type integrase/transposase/recombinase [Spirochaetaceae bacterium]|nr:DDE-type integrase/transposase/recombinase [Spirochaetaceae bacterium]